ncbi:hypothetical protein ACFVFI_37560, partial [Streptomyces sp. NPDC057705]|uniref:hypothetical protein n=1 Tax=Streptomyces sp. NPDC057705 TaxID=3346222 RepID=UPI0036B4D54E
MLEEGFLHGLGEIVHGGAGGLQPGEEREHLPAQGLFHERRTVSPLGSEDLPEPLGSGLDFPRVAGMPKAAAIRGAGQGGGVGRGWRRLEQGEGLRPAQAVLPVNDGGQSGRVVLAEQAAEPVADLPAIPTNECAA